MNVEPRHTIEELERFARKETSARVATRLRGVILAMRGREAEVIIYPGAGHAFFNNERPEAYRRDAANDAWRRTLELFGRHLRAV